MAILNMVGGGGSGGGTIIPLDAIQDLYVEEGNTQTTITWTDPDDKDLGGNNIISWVSSILVRKEGSAPISSSDGTILLVNTTRNQYSNNGYVDTGLVNGTEYFYAVFAVGNNNTEIISNTESIIPLGILNFKANLAGSTIKLNSVGTPTSVSLETSSDGINWNDYTIGNAITLNNVGDRVYFRNKSTSTTRFSTRSQNNYYQFVMTGSIDGNGDVGYLLNKNGTNTTSDNCYSNLFNGCIALRKAPNLSATTVKVGSYYCMFNGCVNLTKVPDLPATSVKESGYERLFQGCLALEKAPNLPATSAGGNYCYTYMFSGCTSLKKAPIISMTSFGSYQNCFTGMFNGCTALEKAPDLLATTLTRSCYVRMFQGCTNLSILPKLKATTLAEYCYYYMFNGCSKIKLSSTQTGEYQTQYRIPYTGTGTTASNALQDMFTSTGGTFTGTPTINTTYYTSNTVE